LKLAGARILLTGASAGIGRCLALQLAPRGARLALLARDPSRLERVARDVRAIGASAYCLTFDLARRDGHSGVVESVIAGIGGVDILINNAGISTFARYSESDPGAICSLIDSNLTGALLLTRAVLPHFVNRGKGHIVNVGSILGSVALPHFAAYCASKFALRGFSEALRRELAATGVRVTYVAPRTTATAMNNAAVRKLFAATKAAVDTPEHVAAGIVAAIERERKDVYFGWPERFIVRLNGILPRMVDRALGRQVDCAERLLQPQSAGDSPRRAG
jgi:short-subunit dehydrogenase